MERVERACGVACLATLANCHLKDDWEQSGGSISSVWDPVDYQPWDSSE